MPNHRGGKLTAQDITSALPAKEESGSGDRFMVKFTLMFIWLAASVSVSFAHVPFWLGDAAFLGVPILCILAFPLNSQAFDWFFSEHLDPRWKISLLQPTFDGKQRAVGPESIDIGDYIRPAEDSEIQSLKAASNQNTLQNQVIHNYYRVIAKSGTPHSRRIKISVFGDNVYDTDPTDPSDLYVRRELDPQNKPGRASAQSTEVAQAFGDLIEILCGDPEFKRENDIVLQLAKKSSHSQSSIRLALRVAESGKLIDRRRKKVAYSIEVLKALRSTASVTGHANCFIRITDSGSMWQYAKAINQKEGFSSSSEIESKEKSRTGNFPISQTGDNNTINVFGSLMEANNYNPSPETIIDSLTQLCTELKKHAADLDQTVVVGELAEIIIAAKNGSDLQEIKSLTKPGSRAAELREWVKAYALPICGPVITAVLEKLLRLPLGG